jgi:hypothetical protein
MAATAEVVVVITCEWCRAQVELTEGELGPTLDTPSFLSTHRQCLQQRRPRD